MKHLKGHNIQAKKWKAFVQNKDQVRNDYFVGQLACANVQII